MILAETFYTLYSILKEFLTFFCGFIISLSAVLTLVGWLARFGEEAKAEKYFDKIKANVLSDGLIPESNFNPPEKIIVLFGGSHRKEIRKLFKTVPLKLKRKKICPKITIIPPEKSETEQKLIMVGEVFSPLRGGAFFDLSIQESLRWYYYYKCMLKLEGAGAEITRICLKEFKSTEYADEIEKLDDPTRIPEMVLNPRSMLSRSVLECILEIFGLIEGFACMEVSEIDYWHKESRDIIRGLCENRYRILFVGIHSLPSLLYLVRKELKKNMQGILIGSYGWYIDKMEHMLLPKISKDVMDKWGENIDMITITGRWRPRGRIEKVDVKWAIIRRKVVKLPEEIGEITPQKKRAITKK